MKVITSQDIPNLTTQGRCVLQFSATWCGPCKTLKKTVEANQGDLGVPFYVVDIDQEQALASEMGIRAVPTLLLFEDGEIIARTTGNKSVSQLQDFIAS